MFWLEENLILMTGNVQLNRVSFLKKLLLKKIHALVDKSMHKIYVQQIYTYGTYM